MTHIGNNVRRLREREGLTREELAARIDKTAHTIYAIEYGYRLPSVPVLSALADVLGVTPNDLLSTDNGTVPQPARVVAG